MGQLEDMALFIRIVEAGGIGKASEQLAIAKSAVSRRLNELEQRLQVVLLNRTTRTWHLTEAGDTFYQKAKEIVADVSQLSSEVAGDSGQLSGQLKLSLPLTFGIRHLSGFIDEFSQKHPEVNFHVDLTDRRVDLIEEGYDCAFRIAQLEDSSLRARRITPVRHILTASPAYLDEHGRPESVEVLAGHRFLKYSRGNSSRSIAVTTPSGEEKWIDGKTAMVSNNGDWLKTMAVLGRGITFLPTFIVGDAIQSGDLEVVLRDHEYPLLHAYAIYPSGRFINKATRALIDFVTERCGECPPWDQALGYD